MRSKTTTYIFVAGVLALLTMPAQVFAQQAAKGHSGSITVFDVPHTGGRSHTEPTAINLGGTITGFAQVDDSSGVFHGFIRTPGGHITTFEAPGAGTVPYAGTAPYAINLAGAVTGQVAGDDLVSHGFIRTPGGHFVTFDPPGSTFTVPAAINVFDQVAGAYFDAGNGIHGFLRAANGTFTIFDVPGAGTGAYQGTSMNIINTMTMDGSVSGFYIDATGLAHGWIRRGDGTIITFDAPGAGSDGSQGQGTYSSAINELGEVGGWYNDSSNVAHSFLRAADGTFTTFDVPGMQFSGVVGLSFFGTAAGDASDADGLSHGFVRALDGTITTFDVPGATDTVPQLINDLGAITGFFHDANGNHGFVRSP